MSNELSIYNNLDVMIKTAQELAKSNLVGDNFIKKPENILIALQFGNELGLSPMQALKNVIVINNRPCLSSDVMRAIVMKQPDFRGMFYDRGKDYVKVTIKRDIAGNVIDFESSFSFADAERAGLINNPKLDPWRKYPLDMCEHRASSRCCRKAYPDALAGIYSDTEMKDDIVIDFVPDHEPTKEQVMTEAVDKFKDAEEPAFETVEEKHEIAFTFTDDQKAFMKPVSQTKFANMYKAVCEKTSESEIAEFAKVFKKTFAEFGLTEFTLFFKIMEDINKTGEVSKETDIKVSNYMNGDVK